jgi:hypothetical protein
MVVVRAVQRRPRHEDAPVRLEQQPLCLIERSRQQVAARKAHLAGRYKNKNNAAAMTASTARAISRSQGVRIGLARRGIHVAFGVGKFPIGRVFIASSYPAFRERAPRITGFPVFSQNVQAAP